MLTALVAVDGPPKQFPTIRGLCIYNLFCVLIFRLRFALGLMTWNLAPGIAILIALGPKLLGSAMRAIGSVLATLHFRMILYLTCLFVLTVSLVSSGVVFEKIRCRSSRLHELINGRPVSVSMTGGMVKKWATVCLRISDSVRLRLNCGTAMTAVLSVSRLPTSIRTLQTRKKGSIVSVILLLLICKVLLTRIRPVIRPWRASTMFPGKFAALEEHGRIMMRLVGLMLIRLTGVVRQLAIGMALLGVLLTIMTLWMLAFLIVLCVILMNTLTAMRMMDLELWSRNSILLVAHAGPIADMVMLVIVVLRNMIVHLGTPGSTNVTALFGLSLCVVRLLVNERTTVDSRVQAHACLAGLLTRVG